MHFFHTRQYLTCATHNKACTINTVWYLLAKKAVGIEMEREREESKADLIEANMIPCPNNAPRYPRWGMMDDNLIFLPSSRLIWPSRAERGRDWVMFFTSSCLFDSSLSALALWYYSSCCSIVWWWWRWRRWWWWWCRWWEAESRSAVRTQSTTWLDPHWSSRTCWNTHNQRRQTRRKHIPPTTPPHLGCISESDVAFNLRSKLAAMPISTYILREVSGRDCRQKA